MEKEQTVSPEITDEGKEKKKKKDNKSRFEQLQQSLQRVIEVLLSRDSEDEQTTPDSKHKSEEKAAKVKDEEKPITQPDIETIRARLDQETSADYSYEFDYESRPTQSSNPESYLNVNHQTIEQNDDIDTTFTQQTREAVSERWQQARARVKEFIDRHRQIDEAHERAEHPSEDREVDDIDANTRETTDTRSNVDSTDRAGQQLVVERPEVETNDFSDDEKNFSTASAMYIAFNELRQRRYRKKLEKIARDQRGQQQDLERVKLDIKHQMPVPHLHEANKPERSSFVGSPPTRMPEEGSSQARIVQTDKKPELRVNKKRASTEEREGERRLDYPPNIEELETKSQPPGAENTVIEEERSLNKGSKNAPDRLQQPRSQAAKSVGEIIEHRSGKLESSSTDDVFEIKYDKADKKPAQYSDIEAISMRQKQLKNFRGAESESASSAVEQQARKRFLSNTKNQKNIDPSMWQKILLVVVNLILIALLVRELVF